jgi:hypothetical protein
MTKRTNTATHARMPRPDYFAEAIVEGYGIAEAGMCGNYPEEVRQRLARDPRILAARDAFIATMNLALADALAGHTAAPSPVVVAGGNVVLFPSRQ